MKKLLFIATVLWLIFGLPLRVISQTGAVELVVDQKMVLAAAGGPYVFNGIRVLPGAELEIEPGTVIYLTPDSQIKLSGKLKAVGTASSPILITALSGVWRDVESTEDAASTTLSYVTFSHFQLPLSFRVGAESWEDVRLEDGVENRLVLSGTGGDPPPDFNLNRLSIVNQDLGEKMLSGGLEFEGSFNRIVTKEVEIEDWHPEILVPWATLSIDLKGKYKYASFDHAVFPHNCSLRLAYFGPDALRYEADRADCASSQLPVVFVPGFGASFNLKQLLLPLDAPIQNEGWRFLRALTPDYFAFLQTLDANHIPYAVAYYDWRLPAEQSSEVYLEPVIERLRSQYRVFKVNLVAHSFGGLVARAYLQGPNYKDTVKEFIELGVPNQGTLKAYLPQEGGELPEDWQAALALVRYYRFIYEGLFSSDRDTIRAFFPSLRELMPNYPALNHNGQTKSPGALLYTNTFLQKLEATQTELLAKVKVTSIVGEGEDTPLTLDVGSAGSHGLWPDGRPLQTHLTDLGDGVVPSFSAALTGADLIELPAAHQALPYFAVKQIINLLYPGLPFQEVPPSSESGRSIWFYFDCPVEVQVKLPDGREYSSVQSSEDIELTGGELLKTDQMIWLAVPYEDGIYHTTVTADSAAVVRQWTGSGSIYSKNLQEGEIWQRSYPVGSKTTPVATLTPTPVPTVQLATATPTPTSKGSATSRSLVQSSPIAQSSSSPEPLSEPILSSILPQPIPPPQPPVILRFPVIPPAAPSTVAPSASSSLCLWQPTIPSSSYPRNKNIYLVWLTCGLALSVILILLLIRARDGPGH